MSQTLRRHASWFAVLSVVMFAVALAPRDASAEACAAQPTSGTWLPANGKGTFETSGAPAPGKAIVITLNVEGGPYKSENQLVVSPDGCRMTGTFLDSEGHRGEAVYGWQGVK